MNCQKQVSHLLSFCLYREDDDMQNEIMGFLSRHNVGKTAEIAEALAVTDYQARYYLLLLEKEGMVQRSPLRRGMATYWFLKGEMQAGQSCSSTT
ncbi:MULTISPECIES: S/F1C fimbrial major subunit operon transcriptional regulator [Enterobacteriaceae]|uniref:S/F1C fimbrial major subunit operon transcriptional regulator n=1 Tax=Enterobacteriaceae TaxID=543 RepID=UPI00128CBBF6|nr:MULTISPECIES: S/F1C fimbrial major subunit operon transcriptional regulator [Enterobacteriaceae]EEZ6998125.1 S/F1C fimbrial major subunit operon transcriptional regulator [Escherichia coli O6]HCC7282004.1 S/F1C fimbrial major subunit operon transcriptional regulator [Escherichia coli O6:H31]EET3009540.1 S/F1C fimbrial major subunit operon transcriptional regulator [Escherichia coli]EEZ7031888.1 S/F1C fimbrial major subunit operon transcriptional regulator [Escherichia coli O6]EEZ7270573.1 S